jgi:uncharacterized protein (TIGR03435 family)
MAPVAALLGDHLWHSTLFAAAVALLALALRRNHARVRYGLWLAASVKFLIPFAVLVALGGRLEWGTAGPVTQPDLALAIDVVSQPFSTAALVVGDPQVESAGSIASSEAAAVAIWPVLAAVWMLGAAVTTGVWLLRWRRVARAVRAGSAVVRGREHDILRRLEAKAGRSGRPLAIVSSRGALEPGVFGIVTPVLLWPASIGERLSDDQVEAIIAHEIAHVRRRDNLAAAVHMVVQAIFWFHPLVWWLGARLVDERERACDQEVIRLGSEPGVYAEGILRTVQFYVESPLVCVAGVTGSDLKRRIEEIMHNRAGIDLSSWRKLLLAGAAVAAVAVPILLGGMSAPAAAQTAPADEQLTFETASIKPNRSGEGRVMMRMLPGGAYEAMNVTARAMILQAMAVAEFQLIGGPDWLDSERYDILAKSPAGAAQAEFAQRYRHLIEERFQLETHRETREMPVYALVLARSDGKLGPKFVPSKSDCSPEGMAAMRAQMNAGGPPVSAGAVRGPVPMVMPVMGPLGEQRPCTNMRSGSQISAGGSTMTEIARMLQQNTGRIVLDRTGLDGRYDFDLAFTPDSGLRGRGPGGGLPPQAGPENPRPVDPDAITIFTAVQEQLGLKLESTRGPVEVVVIDSVERAAEN